jgi:hypothetical protein
LDNPVKLGHFGESIWGWFDCVLKCLFVSISVFLSVISALMFQDGIAVFEGYFGFKLVF